MSGVKPLGAQEAHCAKFSEQIITVMRNHVVPTYIASAAPSIPMVVDPFAGTGGIFDITRGSSVDTLAIEIQPRWAAAAAKKGAAICANMLTTAQVTFADAVITSPVYGNRMSDSHNAQDDSRRHTYTHTYGEPLEKANAGTLQWTSHRYKTFHALAWLRVREWLSAAKNPSLRIFVLNVSDHIRAGRRQPVCRWHRETLEDYGFRLIEEIDVRTKRQRHGENGDLRVDTEKIYVFRLESDGRYFG